MADKQFARSGPAEFDTLADDDPLSELARIVGYDARPAVQQLQELQRHQEAIRRDPAFDLEEELLRAFDSYGAPHTEPVHPDSGLIEHPAAEAVLAEPAVAAEPLEDVVPVAEPHSDPVVASLEQSPDELVSSHPVSDDADSIEKAVESPIEHDVETPVAADIDSAFDLERELELSLGHEDLASEPAPQIDDVGQLSSPVEDLPAFADWQEPLASRLATAGKAVEQLEISESVYIDMAGGGAGQVEDVAQSAAAAVDAPAAASSEPRAAEHSDRLTDVVEPFPVAAAAVVDAAPILPQPAVPVASAPTARKSSYPFTPTFSRATPVASPAGASQQRAFATPVPAPVAAKAPVDPVGPPQAVPEPELETVQGKLSEVESEPSFDIENFELELADIALDMDLPEDDAPEVAAELPAQPVVSHPALVEPADQPFLQALATPSLPEPHRDEPHAPAVVGVEEAPTDAALPFDPAMIGETETGVTPIADLDVPQLPPIEAEEKPVAYSTDYDLDIDAEMAQLFGTPARVAKATSHPVSADVAAGSQSASTGNGSAPLASIDDFDEFEKAMEEDFRRSMEQRRGDVQDLDRLAAMPRAESDGYAEEEGYGRRSQRTMLLAASVAGIIILGGAGVYAWMGGSSVALTGDGPKIILADKEPVKIVPEEKGGKTVPNQDKAVYDRVAGGRVDAPRQEALVSSTEEPMDVVQRTLTPETLPLEGNDYGDTLPGVSASQEDGTARLLPGEAADNAVAEEDTAPVVAPRKVRTMIVKPDGTLVAREEPSVQPENSAVAAVAPAIPAGALAEAGASGTEGKATVALAGSEIRAGAQPAAGAEKVALAAPSKASADELTPVRSVKTTDVGGDPAAVPQARPEAPANATSNGAADNKAATETAAANPSAPLATASVPPGSYVVQIASLPSEAEAQKSYDNLSRKFAEIIGGRGVDIRKAEIAGKGTYYRVRIPAGSREEANALCSRYKGVGGSCLVTK
jgi:hypothetical protein